ncbi:MAG: hypothetical protein H7068_01910 [Pedobacter sp.]|nr:hypothetical protein [Chitinophagaceae bacterium]
MQVLWLASYYPNPYQPENNVDIKTAAKALSKLIPVDVIHVVQLGSLKQSKAGSIHDKNDNYREMIYSFNFKPWGIKFIDAFRYKILYQSYYNTLLNNYVEQFGKPTIIHVHEPLLAGIIAKKKVITWEAAYYVSMYKRNFDMQQLQNGYIKQRINGVLQNALAVFTDNEQIVDKIASIFGIYGVRIVQSNQQLDNETALEYFNLYKIIETGNN